MTGVVYARYSEGPRQTDQSIEGQVADCRAYAEKNGIFITEIYADRHVSGKSLAGRDEFQRMMYDAEHHAFDCVIVWKIDRFGRNRQDIAISKMRLKKAGVKLLYAAESVPDGPEGIILEGLLESLAEYYSAELRQKITRGVRESAKKGRVCCGSLPAGYVRDKDLHVHVDPPVAEAVREAFRMHISGAKTQDIIDMLNARGVRSARGKPMTKARVYDMLRNKKYMGHWELAGIPIEVEPIIDEETFHAAELCCRPKIRPSSVNYLLSQKCYCGYCGALLNGDVGTGKSGEVYHYYTCGTKKKHQPCELKSLRQEAFEDLVLQKTVDKMLTQETIDEIVPRIMKIQKDEQKNSPVAALERRLKETWKKHDRLARAIEEGATGLVGRAIELETEAEMLEADLQFAKIEHRILPEEVIRMFFELMKCGDINDEKYRKSLVNVFIERIDVWNDHAVITYNVQEKAPHSRCSSTVQEVDFNALCSNIALVFPYILLWIPLRQEPRRSGAPAERKEVE